MKHAFAAPLHYLNVKGAQHVANVRDPQIPAALSPVVAGIVSLNDFHPHGMYRLRPKYTFKSGGYTYETVVPADLAKIYNFNPLFSAGISGKGADRRSDRRQQPVFDGRLDPVPSGIRIVVVHIRHFDDHPPQHVEHQWKL